MISDFEEGPPTIIRLSFERKMPAMASNGTETRNVKRPTQPVQGLEPHSQMLTRSVCPSRKQRTTEGGLFPTYKN